MDVEVTDIEIGKLKELEDNPRRINKADYENLKKSIKNFPEICAIGDREVKFAMEDGNDICLPYSSVLEMASGFIKNLGGFEKLAEWGLF